MDGLFEYKSIVSSITDVDVKNRIVTGYLAHFGNRDHDDDVIEKGAFSKSIKERMDSIFFLNQHDWSKPHGKFGLLKEDNTGLYFESKAMPNTSYSNDLLELYALGIVNEHSIGYSVTKAIQGENWARTIKEVKLYEGSNVTLGANSKTPFLGFKNRTLGEINDQVSLIVKAVKNGSFTDDTFMQLEIALKQLQLESYELGKKTLEEPEDSTLNDEPLAVEAIKSFRQSLIIY